MKRLMRSVVLTVVFTVLGTPAIAGVPAVITKEIVEAVELAAKHSGKSFETPAAKRATIEEAQRLSGQYGSQVLKVVQDGGLEMLAAIPKYGDDLLKVATQASPQGRRALAMNAPELLPLARRVGVDAVELEAKIPGQATRAFKLFGDETGKVVAKTVAVEDLPRIMRYGEMADNDATRKLLIEAYQKEGRSLFERIPPKFVFAGGLTAAMLLSTHEMTATERAKAEVLRDNPEIVRDLMKHSTRVWAGVILILILILLWRFRLMPWHRNTGK